MMPAANSATTAQWPSLRRSSWLQSLPPQAAVVVLNACRLLTLKADVLIHTKGDACNGLYGIEQGEVQVSGIDLQGHEHEFTRLARGEWFGEIAVLDDGQRTHDTRTTTVTQLAWLDMSTISHLRQQQPEFDRWLTLLLCQHVRTSFQAIDHLLVLQPRQRLAQRLVQMTAHNVGAAVRINQQALGSLIGLSRQSVNKLLRQWQARGIIKVGYGLVQVLDPKALEREYTTPD